MDKKWCGQINIYQFYLKLLRKELIVQVEFITDIAQLIIENEIIMARSQHYFIKKIRHCNEITHSQYKPYAENAKQHPAQLIQMVPKG